VTEKRLKIWFVEASKTTTNFQTIMMAETSIDLSAFSSSNTTNYYTRQERTLRQSDGSGLKDQKKQKTPEVNSGKKSTSKK
jgi:hypothetical protein